MSDKNLFYKNLMALFSMEHQEVLSKLEELSDSINNLKYEGKLFFGKNTRAIETTMLFLKKKLMWHIKLDEEVIFPFIQMHIPKLDPMLGFLRAERNEFRLTLEHLETLSKQLGDEKDGLKQQRIIDQIKEKGIYAICLIRNHIQSEIESVYKPIDRQLHLDEKKELVKKCLKYNLPTILS